MTHPPISAFPLSSLCCQSCAPSRVSQPLTVLASAAAFMEREASAALLVLPQIGHLYLVINRTFLLGLDNDLILTLT